MQHHGCVIRSLSSLLSSWPSSSYNGIASGNIRCCYRKRRISSRLLFASMVTRSTRSTTSTTLAASSRRIVSFSSSSSASVASVVDDVVVNDDDDDDDHDVASDRPRLNALRQRLAIEEHDHVDNKTIRNFKTFTTSANSSTATTTATATAKLLLNNHNTVNVPISKGCSSAAAISASSSPVSATTTSSSTSSSSSSSSSSRLPKSLEDLIQRLRDVPLPNMMTNPLQDRFLRQHSYLRISLVERCNLRCTYCMPPDGLPQLQPSSSLLQTPELIYLASLFTDMGVRKIRLTGGEPLLRKDLVQVMEGLSHHPLDQLGMTTNGITLARQLPALVEAGLTHVNLSLDTLQADKFERITRRKGWEKVWQSLEAACDMYRSDMDDSLESHHQESRSSSSSLLLDQPPKRGLGRIKLNCVVMRGVNDDELADFCQLTLQYPMLDVRFIEWMPFYDNGWQTNHLVPYQEMKRRLMEQQQQDHNSGTKNNYQLQRLLDGPNDTTKWYQWVEPHEVLPQQQQQEQQQPETKDVTTGKTTTSSYHPRLPDRGRIGFISSMTDHFCATCNRLRLTADGQFKVCLFGVHEVSLRDALRHDVPTEDLQRIIAHAVWNKHWALGGHDTALQLQEHAHDNRPMVLIGG